MLEANQSYNGMLSCAIRPAGIVGEHDRAGITDGLLSTAANAPDWQLHFQLGEGNNLFDCTYVGNVAFALAIAAEALLKTHARTSAGGAAAPLNHEKVDGEAFNVTNDSPIYFWDIAHYIWSLYGRPVRMDKVWQMPQGFMVPIGALAELSTYFTGRKTKMTRQAVKYACMTRYFSCEKLKRRCGYSPLVGLEEGLGRATKSFVLKERAEKRAKGGRRRRRRRSSDWCPDLAVLLTPTIRYISRWHWLDLGELALLTLRTAHTSTRSTEFTQKIPFPRNSRHNSQNSDGDDGNQIAAHYATTTQIKASARQRSMFVRNRFQ